MEYPKRFMATARHNKTLRSVPVNFGGEIIADADELAPVLTAAREYSAAEHVTVEVRDSQAWPPYKQLVERVQAWS